LSAGDLKQNNINIRTLWNKIYYHPIFRDTMGINRFKQILWFIIFDDKITHTFHRAKDKPETKPTLFLWQSKHMQ